MPDGGGISALGAIRQAHRDARVILSSYGNEEEVYQALHAGAAGYLLKDGTREELLSAIHQVHAGKKKWIQPSIQGLISQRANRPELTPRELAVLKLLVAGLTSREIAAVLGNSENTVRKSHHQHLCQTLGE